MLKSSVLDTEGYNRMIINDGENPTSLTMSADDKIKYIDKVEVHVGS